MKKPFRLLLLVLALVSSAFVSCSKEDSKDKDVLANTRWYAAYGSDLLFTIEFLGDGKLITYWSTPEKVASGGQKSGSYVVNGKNVTFPQCYLQYSLATYTFKSAVLLSDTSLEVSCEDKLSSSSDPIYRTRMFQK